MINTYPIRVPAIPVEQALGTFYSIVLPANILLDVCYSERLSATLNPDDGTYSLVGSQRELLLPRLRQISNYIDSAESAFPNSIILAANYTETDGLLEDDEALRWKIDVETDSRGEDIYYLTIPTPKKLAPVIDGQHRLFSFNFADKKRLSTPLVCSVFLDLPKPFQAYLFATINSNQKPVTRSLTYELFGYNIDNESPDMWSPDKLAVSLARKLNVDERSPFKNRILVSAQNDFSLTRAEAKNQGRWMVSMGTIVEGIAKLISKNPKRDGIFILDTPNGGPHSRTALKSISDTSPLRELYLQVNDQIIYLAVLNFFLAAEEIFWTRAVRNSFITKTIGIQALFDILKDLSPAALAEKNFSKQRFVSILTAAQTLDFATAPFANASGSGRTAIKTCIALKIGLIDPKISKINIKDEWKKICGIN